MSEELRELLKQSIIDCIDNKTKDKDVIYTIDYICGYLKGLKDPKDHDIQVSTGTIKDIITHPEKYEDMFKED